MVRFIFLNVLLLAYLSPLGPLGNANASSLTPPPGSGPVPVTVGIHVVDITNINEARNTYDMELDALVSWTDKRLSYVPAKGEPKVRTYVAAAATNFLQEIWTPQIGVANPVGGINLASQKISHSPDGHIEMWVRVSSTLRAKLDYRKFPFDSQVLPMELESFAWNKDVLSLHRVDSVMGFAPDFSLTEWNVTGLTAQEGETLRARNEQPFSVLKYNLEIDRLSQYYVTKIFLTVMIIVALTWVVFWMSSEGLGRRAGISSSGILTVIAYQFVTSSTLPRVSYMTVADKIMIFSMVTIAATMLESIIVDRTDIERKTKIDRICRVLFPVVYLTGLLGLALVSGAFK